MRSLECEALEAHARPSVGPVDEIHGAELQRSSCPLDDHARALAVHSGDLLVVDQAIQTLALPGSQVHDTGPRMRDHLIPRQLQGQHVVGEQPGATRHQMQGQRGLPGARPANQSDHSAAHRHGARVQDLPSGQHREQGKHLPGEEALPMPGLQVRARGTDHLVQ